MQSHNQKKQQFVTATAATGRYHANKTYPYYHQQQPGGDVGAFSGGPGGAAGASLRLNQYPQPHPPPTAAPQPPQGPPQLRTQQAPPHNPHNATAAQPPHSQHHTHTHATLTQHSQHHQVLQSGAVGGHGAGGVGTGVGQVGVPPGPSPAPPGPPHELGTQPLPPGSTPQIQQGSGGSLPVASAHNMMYPSTTQNQPQGPQGNAQGTYFPHPAGPNAPPHQPRPVTLTHSQPMPNFSVMPPSMVHFYHSANSGNLIYHMPFQPVAPRQPTPHTPPGQYHPTPIAPGHPPAPYQPLHYQPNQGVYYPPPTQQPQLKSTQAVQREKKALAIVDPNTGKNILDDINNEKPDKTPTPPQSSESSARNTPAPSGTPPTKTESAAIAAKFAEEVAKKAAEKDIDIETPEPVRTNKQSDSSSSTVIVSDSRESKEKLNNSIGNKTESVSTSLVDSAIGKVVPDTVEAVSAQAKQQQQQQQQQQDSQQQVPLQQYPQQVPQLQPPPHLSHQVPQQSLQPSVQLSPSLQQLPQTNVLQLSQPPVQPLPQPPVQQLPQPSVQQLPQPSVQQLPQPSVQQLPQPPVQQLPQPAVQQLPQPPVQQLPQPPVQQLPQPPVQQVPQPAVQQLPQPVVQQVAQAAVQQLPQLSVHQLPQPPSQPMQQLPQQGTQAVSQLPQPLPQQVLQQPPPKQKSPVPQHPQQSQSQQKQQQQQQQHHHQHQHQQQAAAQQPQQPQQSVQPLPQPPPETTPSHPPSQQLQQPQSQQTQKSSEPSPPKTEPAAKPQVSAPPPEVREPASGKPESQLPVKQSNPKPTVVPTPFSKEKEPTPEPQSTQSKRGKVPREEPTLPQDNVDDGAAQPQQPQIPAQSQKAASHPIQQPVAKYGVQIQNTKEKEKKEKTPEPPPQAKSQPSPPLKPSPSPPPVKESAPPVVPPATPNDKLENERDSKEEEVSNVECEVNNVHEEKEQEVVDEEEGEGQEKKEEGPQLKYSYKEDQWSPLNQDGKRQYDRRFLLELQNNPLSLKKPESLPNLEVVRDGPGRPKPFDPRGSMAHVGSGPDFTPDYVKSSLGNKHPRIVGRNSQQRGREAGGSVPRGGGGRSGSGKVIIITPTAREPKLKTAEHAWKPSAKENAKSTDDDQVLKAMRGILNKLTPEKFGKLVDTVKTMPIDTTERLSSVIDLIFEKAVDEQSFSSTYAQMCQVLSLMSVRGNGNESNSGKSEVKFRNLIINKCQKEFEKDNADDLKAERSKEIAECTDPEKKQELEAKLVYDETKLRKRSVGNIRFIGELYKLRMLTSPIMMRIIGTLLERGDEESLECLCKLLTTIGKILETQCAQQPKALSELDKYFKLMDKIVHERQTVTRVRFLMMDVIDLRQNSWVPRREDNKPKTKAQVQEEVKREEFEQQLALATNPGRRDDRVDRDRDRRRLRDNRSSQMSDEGWSTVASTKGRGFDSSRLKTFSRHGLTELTLRSNFGDWGRGSSGGGLKDHNENKQQESNRFNVLVDSMGGGALSGDNRRNTPSMSGNRLAPGGGPPRQGGFGSKSMPPLNDKESAISAVKKLVAPDRSKSTSRPESRDNSVPREPEAVRQYPSVDVDALEKIAIAIIEEYTHNSDPEEAKLCVKEKFTPQSIKYFVQFSLEWVLDRDSKRRKMVGQLYHDLIVEKLLTVDQLLEGSQEILGMVEDFLIDIPQVCEYLGEIFAPCLNDNAVPIHKLLDLAQFAGNKKAHIFACILSRAALIMSPNKVSDLWNSSGLSWSSVVPPSANIEDFLAKHQVEFTVDRNKSGNQTGWNPQKVEAEFLKLFKRASNDEIFGWIDANIGNDAKSSKFIRALVTALVESQAATSNDGSSIRVSEDFEDKMKNRLAVVLKYVDNNEMLEMQCIYALQALCVKHQYPPGLLEKCFNAFYDSEVVSEEAFEEWVNSKDPDEQEGKGVCITSVQSFMRWLKEADEEG